MKVSQAVIRLYLKTAKVLSDGSSPIMLMVSYNGKKEKSSGCSCSVKFWDKKNECVKKGYPNWLVINQQIQAFKQLAIDARNRFIIEEIEYNSSMIISSMFVKEKSKPKTLRELSEEYITEKCLRRNTRENHRYAVNLLYECVGEVMIFEIDERMLRSFATWCNKHKKLSDGVVRSNLSIIKALCNYAVGLKYISSNPFLNFKFTKTLKQSNKIQYIHRSTIKFMQEYLLDKLIEQNGTRWSYRAENIKEFVTIKGRWYPLYMYLLMYMFQGVAPIDMCLIRRSDINVRKINGQDYWCIDIKRTKTNKSVPIRIKRHTVYTEAMMSVILMFGEGEYLLPILSGYSERTDDVKKSRVKWVFNRCMRRLRDDWALINEKVIERNVELKNEPQIPLIDLECTYYSVRHSYAQNYCEAGGSPLALATLLGRSVEGIGAYVKELSKDEDLTSILLI